MKTVKVTEMLTKEEALHVKGLRALQTNRTRTLLFPIHFSVWTVEAKNILRQNRTHKVIVGLDLIKGKYSFAESIPDSSDEVVHPLRVVNSQIPIDTKKDAVKEHIRNYFIHYKKVWSPPVIELEKEEVIYMPYTVFSSSGHAKQKAEKNFLLEHHTRNLDALSNHPHLERFFLKGSEIG